MKKLIALCLALGMIVVIGLTIVRFLKPTTKTAPQTPQSGPTPTKTNEEPVPTKVAFRCDAITILSPKDNAKIASPLTVNATVDNRGECHWTVFEAQAGTIEITDGLGKVVGKGVLKTTQDWAVSTPVTYTATITLSKPSTSGGTLTITEENPSGKANPQKHSTPVTFY